VSQIPTTLMRVFAPYCAPIARELSELERQQIDRYRYNEKQCNGHITRKVNAGIQEQMDDKTGSFS